MKIIARIHTDMPDKFGIPRQSTLVNELTGKIIFEPEYRAREAFLGIEEFSHLWLLWEFSENIDSSWSPTVRPPRLGGEEKRGVFATRSPFRPNPIGLSCVRFDKIEYNQLLGPILYVSGVDIMDNTPIYDIKPYIAYTDSHPQASEGFAKEAKEYSLNVDFDNRLLSLLPDDKKTAIIKILQQDPRPAYHDFPERIYGVKYAGFDIKFKVKEDNLTVVGVEKLDNK